MVKKEKKSSFEIEVTDIKKLFDDADVASSTDPKLVAMTEKDFADTRVATTNVADVIGVVMDSLSKNTNLHASIVALIKNMTAAFEKEGYSHEEATRLTIETIKTLQPLFKV